MKKRIFWWLLALAAVILIFFLVTRSIAPEDLPTASTESPRPGYYTGDAVEFILTPVNEITHFSLSDLSFLYCSYSWEDQDAFLVNNHLTIKGENTVNLVYAANGKFFIRYSLNRCGTRRVWFARHGVYTAQWISESPSSP